jgi:5'-nucleotidase
MKILLTNDDGIYAVGLRAMFEALVEAGHEVHCVAPISEQSAVGHAITMATPLRARKVRENGFAGHAVHGTPADCVKLALCCLLDDKPDLVVSGINAGANVGVDILYSGTVSAATEGAMMGYPALAVSMDEFQSTDLSEQAAWAARLVEKRPWEDIEGRVVLNLNFPAGSFDEVKGLRICPHTGVAYRDWYDARNDPRGNPYYWLVGEIPADQLDPGCDRALLTDKYITLTPLRFRFTDAGALRLLSEKLGSRGPAGLD